MWASTGRLRDPAVGRPGDQMIESSMDVRGTGQTCFLNSTYKHIKLILTGYSRLDIEL